MSAMCHVIPDVGSRVRIGGAASLIRFEFGQLITNGQAAHEESYHFPLMGIVTDNAVPINQAQVGEDH